MRSFGALVGLLGLALVVAACGGGGSEQAGGTAAGGSGTTVTLAEFKFAPASLSLKVGQEVTFTLKNTGATAHNFVVADLGVNSGLVDPSKSKTIKFTPQKEGTFRLLCDVAGHEAAGMKGEVKVSS